MRWLDGITDSTDVSRRGIGYPVQYSWASLVAQMVKNLPTVQETWVQSLGWEDPQEESMATHSSIHAWRGPWTEIPSGLQSMAQLCPTLCDPMDCSMPGFPVLHDLPEFAQTCYSAMLLLLLLLSRFSRVRLCATP